MLRVISEFKEFLKEYKVVGLAVAFVIGSASTTLVQSIVNNLVMPLVTPFIPGGEWAIAKWTIWKFVIGWGPLLSAIINFLVIAFVVFLISKYMFGEEKVAKK